MQGFTVLLKHVSFQPMCLKWVMIVSFVSSLVTRETQQQDLWHERSLQSVCRGKHPILGNGMLSVAHSPFMIFILDSKFHLLLLHLSNKIKRIQIFCFYNPGQKSWDTCAKPPQIHAFPEAFPLHPLYNVDLKCPLHHKFQLRIRLLLLKLWSSKRECCR